MQHRGVKSLLQKQAEPPGALRAFLCPLSPRPPPTAMLQRQTLFTVLFLGFGTRVWD